MGLEYAGWQIGSQNPFIVGPNASNLSLTECKSISLSDAFWCATSPFLVCKMARNSSNLLENKKKSTLIRF